jgi:hypothetical protein
VEYQWEDFWESNLSLFRKFHIILNTCVAVFLWIIVKDGYVGLAISIITTLILLAYWFICITTGLSYAEDDSSWTDSFGHVFRKHFWYWFWIYPNLALTELFVRQVKKNGTTSYRVTAFSWLVFIGLFLHILLNPYLD